MDCEIMNYEIKMWEAVLRNDVDGFKELVSDNAVMVCGGYRCLGCEYAEYRLFVKCWGAPVK